MVVTIAYNLRELSEIFAREVSEKLGKNISADDIRLEVQVHEDDIVELKVEFEITSDEEIS